MYRSCRILAFVAVATLFTGASASAQLSTADLTGRVTDSSGAVLPGVTVTVTQTDTGLVRTTVSDETGTYLLTNLPTGPYRLEVALSGFRTYVQTGIVLQVGATPTINAGSILDMTPLGATTFSLTTGALGAKGTGTAIGSTASTIIADPAGIFDVGTRNISLVFTPPSFSGDTTHPALYVARGTLSLSGNGFLVNNKGGTPLGVGTYRLIQQASGSVTTSGGS